MGNVKEIDLFDDTKDSLLDIPFPLCLKSVNKHKQLYWRYMPDGRYELISFNGVNTSFVFGNNYDKTYSNVPFDNGFLIRQCQLMEISSEDEFVGAMQLLLENHGKFLNPLTEKEDVGQSEQKPIEQQSGPEEDYPF